MSTENNPANSDMPPSNDIGIESARIAKLPPFWKEEPAIWFLQVEATFRLYRITQDSTKYEYLVANLDPSVLFLVKDILMDTANNNKYATTKKRIIDSFAESAENQIKRVLSGLELGDQKPSHCLQRLKSLSAGKISDEVLKTLFIERLPEKVRSILAVCDSQEIDHLGIRADRIMETLSTSTTCFVSEVQPDVAASNLSTKKQVLVPSSFWGKRSQMYSSMQLQYNKKLIPPSTPISAESVDGACSGRLFITDKKSKIQFLVDTGAEISVYPSKNRKNPQKLSLYAANGTEIKTFGSINLSLDLGLRRPFSWSFILADVSRPIIGADFLRQFHLLPDLNTRKLVDGQTLLAVSGSLCKEGSIGIKMVSGDTSFHQLFREYPEIIMHNENFSSEHGIYHHIVTHGPPVSCRSRRLDPEKLKAAKEEFQYMLNKGIIQPSRSNWANPLHMVKKPNGEWRPCGNLHRALNTITVPDKYPVPYLTDFQMHLNGVRIFSKLDLMKAFYQIPVHPHNIPKTAVITPFGLFEFLRMPFGLCNAAQTFQRFIDEVCRGLHFVFVYIDDVCVFSKSEEEHLEHLKILFERFKKYGIFINPSKCVFGQTEIDFRGHHVTPDGIKPLTEKVDVIKSFPLPKTIKELRRFLAMLNFYRKFLPHGAQLQSVLNDLLKGQTKKNDTREIDWSDELKQAFIKCRESLSNASFLTHPIPNASLVLKVDASTHAIGAVLEQYVDGSWQPLGFFSKKLTPTQMKYSTYDRELLTIFKSVQHFRYLLEARKFIVLTDHKPLTFAFKQKLEKASPRQRNHLDFIAQFSTDIR
ncbi:uncharacterized protein LOC131997313 [Stomoxys calcitrans]|uniref:uncharacterized protein LOC131997313 n=1 Tax=Stomoxys calcitrans TaxID=35570 RepID=UPI0027E235FE|nr:uncharacterized protein LOC131997313 [Stomoxys calcitrans]